MPRISEPPERIPRPIVTQNGSHWTAGSYEAAHRSTRRRGMSEDEVLNIMALPLCRGRYHS